MSVTVTDIIASSGMQSLIVGIRLTFHPPTTPG